ncbi:MAG: hypothetical protein E7055_12385 [Lentisphaerae bacterium]|nr:hypothetical protein [Lentisphaerota bacterium]
MENNLCGNLINEYYVRQFRRIAADRGARIAALKTRKDAERYVEEVRAAVRAVFPAVKYGHSPLKPRTVRTFQAGSLHLENVMFDSLPDYPVTGNFYRPARIGEKIPALLHLCGHNLTGKINPRGKALNLSLAAGGMAVLAIDPLDQGERLRFPEQRLSQNVRGHNQLGKRLTACGTWFGDWRVRDAMAGLDYLLSRPEVDPSRVYVAGCSGGGTMTALLNACEDRLAGAMPSCYITSWKHNVENELPVDAEQTPPGLSAAGLEMADLLIAAAPRPIHLSGEADDVFDLRGTREVFDELKKIYGLLGCPERVTIFIGPNDHGLWPEQREAGRKFLFGLAGLPENAADESDLPDVPDEQLKVLSVPTVFELSGVKKTDELLKEELRRCEENRPAVRSAEELRARVADVLKIRPDAPAPYYRVLRPAVPEPFFSRILLEDGELPLGVLHSSDLKYQPVFPPETFLYIPHEDYRTEIPVWKQEFPDRCGVAFDPVLIGEMRPAGCDQYGREFGSLYGDVYHFAACSLMLGRPIAGIAAAGILGALKLMRQGGAEKITLIGAGQSGVTALLAAFLGGALIDRTILVNALPSYAALFDEPNPICPQALIVPGFLRIADLPDLYRAVRPELRENPALPHLTDPLC